MSSRITNTKERSSSSIDYERQATMAGGKSSRDKGARGELELAHIIGAEKVSGYMVPGPDLVWMGLSVEVKRRKTNRGFALPEGLLREADLVAVRADRGEWVISMSVDTLLKISRGER